MWKTEKKERKRSENEKKVAGCVDKSLSTHELKISVLFTLSCLVVFLQVNLIWFSEGLNELGTQILTLSQCCC